MMLGLVISEHDSLGPMRSRVRSTKDLLVITPMKDKEERKKE